MQLSGSKILVTGGAGFVGSHIVRDLLEHGAGVTVYDNFSTGHESNLAGLGDDVQTVRGDILDYDALHKVMRGHDGISHMAAQLEITRSIGNPIYDLETNTIGTLNVLRSMEAQGIDKLVEASSAGVYGQARFVPQTEEHPTEPNWEYGVSKLAAEKYSAIYCERTGMSAFSLRYAIVYGEREWYGRVLTLFLRRALKGQPPVVFGQGDQVRDFVHASDIARLHTLCMESDSAGHTPLNGSTNVATSVLELAHLVCEVTGAPEPIFDDPREGEASALADGRVRLPSELQTMQMSYERAETMLGWRPQVALREGLEREWAWLQDNADRWTEMSY
jgi:UDP-glucose 4-epimerase